MTALTASHDAPPSPADNDLAALVHAHQQGVWRLLRFLGADASEADDLTQETFLAIARSGFEQRTTAQTAAYLRSVAKNQLLQLRRRQKRQVSVAPLEAAEQVWAESVEPVGWDHFTDALRACVDKLEGRAAQAVRLCYQEDKTREAIAEQLGMQPDGVKTLLRRTRAVLRQCIERTTNEP